MKTLRQLRDELAADLMALGQLDLRLLSTKVAIQTRIADTVAYIETCSEEEFEHLGTDVPEGWDT